VDVVLVTAAASGDIAVLPLTFAVKGASQDLALEETKVEATKEIK